MTRVVLDTNVYISALMFGGLPGSLLDLAFLRAFTLIISPALFDELDEKLRAKFAMTVEDVAFLRTRLENIAQVVEPRETLISTQVRTKSFREFELRRGSIQCVGGRTIRPYACKPALNYCAFGRFEY